MHRIGNVFRGCGRERKMEYLTPILMCILFLFGCAVLAAAIIFVWDFFTKRALLRASVLDEDSAAALLGLSFGIKKLCLSRCFPVRTPLGTKYEKVPFVMIFGKKIFVITVCDQAGPIQNTDEDVWKISLPAPKGKKRTLSFPNPVLLASHGADTVRALLETVKLPYPVVVEPVAILTAKKHKISDPEAAGLKTLTEVLKMLRALMPQNKNEIQRLARENERLLNVFKKYTLSEAQAIAKERREQRIAEALEEKKRREEERARALAEKKRREEAYARALAEKKRREQEYAKILAEKKRRRKAHEKMLAEQAKREKAARRASAKVQQRPPIRSSARPAVNVKPASVNPAQRQQPQKSNSNPTAPSVRRPISQPAATARRPVPAPQRAGQVPQNRPPQAPAAPARPQAAPIRQNKK